MFLAIVIAAAMQEPEQLPPPKEKPKVIWVETKGKVKKNEANFDLIDKDGTVWSLAFDNMQPFYKDLLRQLSDLEGKEITVVHRKGYIEFGKTKMLLAKDFKERKQ
jgi:hypothetical protein